MTGEQVGRFGRSTISLYRSWHYPYPSACPRRCGSARRGVLIHVAAYKGVDMLGPTYEITADDLQGAPK